MVELGQEAGLVDEAFQADVEGFLVALGAHPDAVVVAARGQHARHVFLDRDGALERMVERDVDDAEAAFAEDAGDFEIGQAGADRQAVFRTGDDQYTHAAASLTRMA